MPDYYIHNKRKNQFVTLAEKNESIWKKIQLLTDKGFTITFDNDWGGWSATIYLNAPSNTDHYHIGEPEYTYEQFIDELWKFFTTLPV